MKTDMFFLDKWIEAIRCWMFTGDAVHTWCVLGLVCGLLYWVWLIWGRKIGLAGKKRVLVISLSLLLSIWFFRIAYSVSKELCTWACVFENLVHSIKTFSVDAAYIEFAPCVSKLLIDIWPIPQCCHWVVKVGFTVLYFLAPITSVVVILNVILHFFSKVKLRFYSKYSRKEIYYFSGLNESSYALAKSICESDKKKVMIVFSDAYLDDEEEKSSELFYAAKSLGAICLKDDILHLPIRKKGKKTLVLIDDDEIKNVQALLTMIEKMEKNPEKECTLTGAEVLLFSDDRTFSMVSDKIKGKLDELYKTNLEKRPRVRTVNSYGNMVKNMLKEMPLYEPLIRKRKSDEKTEKASLSEPENKTKESQMEQGTQIAQILQATKRNLYVTIIGTGKIGTEVFLSTYWYGQILGYSLHINVVSKESEDSFLDRINFINPEIFGTAERIRSTRATSVRVKEMFCEQGSSPQAMRTADYNRLMRIYPSEAETAQPYFTYRYYQTDIRDDDLSHKLEVSHWEDGFCLRDSNYFVVALGGDEENLQVTEKLNKYISEYHLREKAKTNSEEITRKTVIACAVYHSALSRILVYEQEKNVNHWGTYVYAFGAFEKVYTKENIYMHGEDVLRGARIQGAYDECASVTFDAVEWQEEASHYENVKKVKSQYDYWANLSRALHLRYKVFSAGFFAESVFTCGSIEARETANADALKKYEDLVGNQKPDEKETTFIHNLSWLEHRRWCAYTRVSGFTCPEDYKYYQKYTKSHKEMNLKLHPCLVEGSFDWRTDKKDCLDVLCDELGTDYKVYDHPNAVLENIQKRIQQEKENEDADENNQKRI